MYRGKNDTGRASIDVQPARMQGLRKYKRDRRQTHDRSYHVQNARRKKWTCTMFTMYKGRQGLSRCVVQSGCEERSQICKMMTGREEGQRVPESRERGRRGHPRSLWERTEGGYATTAMTQGLCRNGGARVVEGMEQVLSEGLVGEGAVVGVVVGVGDAISRAA